MIEAKNLSDLDRAIKMYTHMSGATNHSNECTYGNWKVLSDGGDDIVFEIHYMQEGEWSQIVEYIRDKSDDTDRGYMTIYGDEFGFNDDDSKKIAENICKNFGLDMDAFEIEINGKVDGKEVKWLTEEELDALENDDIEKGE